MKRKLLFLLFIVFGFIEGRAQGDVVVTNTNYQSAFIVGYPSVYTVTVTNNGPGDVDNVTVTNPIPVGITQFSWVGDNGSSGTDVPLNDLIPTLNAGETITYTITIFVPVGYTGTLDSLASVSAPIGETDATNNTALDSDVAPAPASADIVVFKTDNDLNYTAGSTQTYSIILTNHGPAAATNVTIQDLVPAGINPATVTWTGDNGTSGTGNLSDAIPNMAVGDTIIYTVVMPVPANFDQTTDLVNTVTTNSTTVDPNPLCPNCTDTDVPDPQANIVTIKTNGQTQYLTDENTTYTITVTNQGPSEALNVEVTDNMPPGISDMTWSSDLGPSGTGNMVDTIATLAVGQTVTYTVTIAVPLNYNLAFVNLTNTVSVTSDTPDPVPACPGCSDTDTPRPRWVTVDVGTYTVPELVEDILIDSDCANVSNFTAQVGSSANPGVGYFHRNNSDFPLKSGVVIRCGQAKACEGPFNDDQFTTVASGLPDNNSIGWPATNNQDLWGVNNDNGNSGAVSDVSYVQFDFIPLTDNFSFRFLFASNEYGTFQCGFSDVFAFILKDQVTGTLTNVAVVPGTNVPISVTSIRDQAFNNGCVSSYPQYFDQFNQGDPANADIDMRGQTVPMIASASVIPNHLYSIKLVIGDYTDQAFDSAVFIEAGSFNVGQADLGNDMLVSSGTAGCYGSSMTLDTELDPTVYDFEWTLDGAILPLTTPAITVTQEGEYCVRAYTGSCEQIDCIVVEFRDPVIPIGNEPSQATACPGDNFDLTQIEPDMFGVLNPANYDIGYYHTQFEAENEISPIGPRTNYPGFEGEIIWVKVLETNSGFDCYVVFPFVLHYENCGTANNPPDLALCDDLSNDGVEDFDLTPQIAEVLGSNPPANYIITFHTTLADANTGANDLTGINAYQNTSNPQTIYVRMEDVADATSFSTVDFTLTVHPQPATPNPADVSVCSDVGYTLPALPAGQTYHTATGGDALTEIPAGTVYNTPGTTTVYIFAQSATTPNCTAEGSFDITIIQTPVTPNPANVSVCSDDGYQLPILPAGQTYHTASGGALATEVVAGTIYNTPNTTTTLYIFAQSGTTPNCTREGSFTITVHPSPATPNPADVTVCDGYLLPNLPAGQTYHSASGGAAATQIAAGTTINTPGANTIYVFAQSGTTPNCTAEGDFVVTVNTTPTAMNPSNVTVCNDVGYTLPALPAGSTYHSASGGAAATLIAAGTVINTLGANTIYIYSQTGTTPNCTAEGSFVVTVNAVPTAINPSNVSVCSATGYVLPALPAGSTYHSASGGSAATTIAAGTTINTVGANTIYVYSQTGTTPNCTAEGSFVVTVNQTPNTPVPTNVVVCSADGYTLPVLPSGQTYHSASGGSGATEILAGTVYTTPGTTTIYVFAQSGTVPNCTAEASFTITVNQTPAMPNPLDVTVCESIGYTLPALAAGQTYHSAPGGSAATQIVSGTVIDTVGANTIYIFSQTGTTPNCTSEADFVVNVSAAPIADAPSNVISCDSYVLPFLNSGSYFGGPGGTGTSYAAGDVITSSMTMYVFAQTGTTPNCTDEHSFTITIFNSPVALPATDIHVCDDNNDGFSCLFDLTPAIAQVTGGNAALSVSFHETATDAQTGASPIATSSAYCNIVASSQTIHIRVFDPAAPQCSSQQTVDIFVDPVPVPNPVIPDYRLCDYNAPGDNQESFDLTTMDGVILNGQTGITVTYYVNNADAVLGTNAIPTPTAYTNTGSPQQICARLTNDTSGCFAVACFNLVVDPLPAVFASSMNACGDATGISIFDLTSQSLTVSGGVPGLGVSYYLTQAGAQAGDATAASYIADPVNFQNTVNPQVVYASVVDLATGCISVAPVTLTVSQGPPAAIPQPLEVCDPNNDCFAPFDLTLSIADILGSPVPPAGITVTFHETLTDAQNGQTPIATPGSYTNIVACDQVVYVSVAYDATGCRTVVELPIHVN
ncbi:choice-of-anchor L domain-containing protein, partial [Flavobacterium longum]|uniref:choice-of-anchor L domain-containing protein n=1 Tax=Flavobacterium longum TaxID=1299340 RepID=UPI0039E82CEC